MFEEGNPWGKDFDGEYHISVATSETSEIEDEEITQSTINETLNDNRFSKHLTEVVKCNPQQYF